MKSFAKWTGIVVLFLISVGMLTLPLCDLWFAKSRDFEYRTYPLTPLKRNTRSSSRANSVIPCRSEQIPSVILPVWITLLRDFRSVWK